MLPIGFVAAIGVESTLPEYSRRLVPTNGFERGPHFSRSRAVAGVAIQFGGEVEAPPGVDVVLGAPPGNDIIGVEHGADIAALSAVHQAERIAVGRQEVEAVPGGVGGPAGEPVAKFWSVGQQQRVAHPCHGADADETAVMLEQHALVIGEREAAVGILNGQQRVHQFARGVALAELQKRDQCDGLVVEEARVVEGVIIDVGRRLASICRRHIVGRSSPEGIVYSPQIRLVFTSTRATRPIPDGRNVTAQDPSMFAGTMLPGNDGMAAVMQRYSIRRSGQAKSTAAFSSADTWPTTRRAQPFSSSTSLSSILPPKARGLLILNEPAATSSSAQAYSTSLSLVTRIL